MFNVFSIVNCKIECSVPCNVPESLIPDLTTANIKLSQATSLQEDIEDSQSFSSERAQQCKFLIGFFFNNQA